MEGPVFTNLKIFLEVLEIENGVFHGHPSWVAVASVRGLAVKKESVVDGSVAIITVGVGGSIDTNKIVSPVIGFILDPKGLMYNLTLEGTKITRISK